MPASKPSTYDPDSPADTAGTVTATAEKPKWNLVKATHPMLHGKILFRSVSEQRARDFVQNRYPRGSEAYLQTTDGKTLHYEAERTGAQGQDVELWQPFDPDAWTPQDQAPPPGQDEWADKEG